MSTTENTGTPAPASRELVLTRDVAASAESLFKVWTQRLTEWFAPRPLTTTLLEMDLRPGGVIRTLMQGPDGAEYPTKGIFLEIVENRKIVFTDAYGANWEPSPDIFFTAVVTFDPLPDGRTRYTARALHWTEENCAKHAAMGFQEGWGQCLDQLVELAAGEDAAAGGKGAA